MKSNRTFGVSSLMLTVASWCIGFFALSMTSVGSETARPLPRSHVSANHRFIVQDNGQPFFYFADTAWEPFHRLNRKEGVNHLRTRAEQGFTVVQAVALAELDGLTDPNAFGKLPLINRDAARPAVTPGARFHRFSRVRLLGPCRIPH